MTIGSSSRPLAWLGGPRLSSCPDIGAWPRGHRARRPVVARCPRARNGSRPGSLVPRGQPAGPRCLELLVARPNCERTDGRPGAQLGGRVGVLRPTWPTRVDVVEMLHVAPARKPRKSGRAKPASARPTRILGHSKRRVPKVRRTRPAYDFHRRGFQRRFVRRTRADCASGRKIGAGSLSHSVSLRGFLSACELQRSSSFRGISID